MKSLLPVLMRTSGCRLALTLAVGLATSAQAQLFTMDWHKIAGGGGVSSGGSFYLAGTIGQADATPQTSSGGGFALTGGFWAAISVEQTPGAPALNIKYDRSAKKATVYWQFPSTCWKLQQNADLTTTNWIYTPGITNDGTNNLISYPDSANGYLFFRLKMQ